MVKIKHRLKQAAVVVVVLLLAIQLVPLARTNPPVTREIRWDSPETRALADRACLDCHSNRTIWPWYSHVAPASMLVVDHVTEGRRHLNFSEWDRPNAKFDDVEQNVRDGEMPISNYLWMHHEARLTAAETARLLSGLRATYAADTPIPMTNRADRSH